MITTNQAASRARVSRQTISRWLSCGLLIGTRVGPIWLVDEHEVDRVQHLRRRHATHGRRGPTIKGGTTA